MRVKIKIVIQKDIITLKKVKKDQFLLAVKIKLIQVNNMLIQKLFHNKKLSIATLKKEQTTLSKNIQLTS